MLCDASLSFQKSIGDRYPEDGALIALRAASWAGSEEICETDEVAKGRCLRLSKLYLNSAAEQIDSRKINDLVELIAQEADEEVTAILVSDAHEVAKGQRVGKFRLARFTNYATTIVQWIDKARKGHGRGEWMWKIVNKLINMWQDTPPDS